MRILSEDIDRSARKLYYLIMKIEQNNVTKTTQATACTTGKGKTMIIYLEGQGWAWIKTDDTPTEAVIYEACVRGAGAYAHCEGGIEKTRAEAEECLARTTAL